MLETVGTALFNKGIALKELDRSEDAVSIYDEVITRFGEGDQPEVLEAVASAVVSKGYSLIQMNRSEDAIAAYYDVITRLVDGDQI